MRFEEIRQLISAQFGEAVILKADTNGLQPSLTIETANLVSVCTFLHEEERLFFDHLACVTAIDNGPVVNTIEVIYNLTSLPYEHDLTLKVVVNRNTADGELPIVLSVSGIWRTADWHEREAYDLVGIRFDGHPDLRRILMPNDWVGHPLRKDYQPQEIYHGIQVKY